MLALNKTKERQIIEWVIKETVCWVLHQLAVLNRCKSTARKPFDGFGCRSDHENIFASNFSWNVAHYFLSAVLIRTVFSITKMYNCGVMLCARHSNSFNSIQGLNGVIRSSLMSICFQFAALLWPHSSALTFHEHWFSYPNFSFIFGAILVPVTSLHRKNLQSPFIHTTVEYEL